VFIISIIKINTATKQSITIIIIWLLFFQGFVGFLLLSSDNAFAGAGNDLIIPASYTVSGSETWKNITVKGTGQLKIPSGATLNAWNIFLENGSEVEISGGKIFLSNSSDL
jgi:hypothetical protein